MNLLSKGLLIAAALGLGACAPAIERVSLSEDALAPAQAPTPVVGSVMKWCIGQNNADTCEKKTETIIEVAGEGCFVTDNGEERWTRCVDGNPYFLATSWDGPKYGKGQREWSREEGTLWPLQVGTRYSFHESGKDENETWERDGVLIVTGAEKITVPAGTFDTYRIEVSLGKNRYYEMNFAPDLGQNIFFHRRHKKNGDDEPQFLVEVVSPKS